MSIVHVSLNVTVTNGPEGGATFQIVLLKDGVQQLTVAVNGGAPLAANASAAVVAGPFDVDVSVFVSSEIKFQVDALTPAKTGLASIARRAIGPRFSVGQIVHPLFPLCTTIAGVSGTIQRVHFYQEALSPITGTDLGYEQAFYEVAFTDPRFAPLIDFGDNCLLPG